MMVIALAVAPGTACRSEAPTKQSAADQGEPRADQPSPGSATTAPVARVNEAANLADYYERATRQFALADFLKPSGEDVPDRIVTMSPLIVREVAEPYADLHFGMSIEAALGLEKNDEPDKPVIYYHEDAATIAGVERQRLAFMWLFDKRRVDNARLLRLQGFRMTLDEKGFAIFWEVLDLSPPRMIYVAQSVEDAAKSEFGPPEAPRRFSVELPFSEASQMIVPRILSDGPQPMGPFVYIDGHTHEVTTLLCRCMPSQVADFRHNQYFDLRPLPAEGADHISLSDFQDLLRRTDDRPLDEVIRIPSAFSAVP
ncbi:MAG: hypothetical protein H6819_12910 [Phycisphaerales bacterium]|nr:hypothetical protein [Phycisphaerales bacterium]MCB9857797.1 hypothetical protein [Phycisphaerales bacterium]MCB9863857.1 hypothetical protein [Phycisphaerales bacterium]